MRTLTQIETEVRFLGATILTESEDWHGAAAWAIEKGFIAERVVVTGDGERTLIRMPDYKVRRGPA